jgi:small conductance mechanosensitive channel
MLWLLNFRILLTAFLTSNIPVYGVKAIRILLIIVGLVLTGKIGNRLISGLLNRIPGTWNERRIKTLRDVGQNLLRYVLYFFGAIMILSELNVDARSILTGAGIVGLAAGIGAQTLVKDVVTGFFILFEDQFAVGDCVNIAGVTGTVEDMGLRVTKLREATGDLHIISNGEIRQVTRLNTARDGG